MTDYLAYASASSEQNGDGSWAVKAPYRTLRSLTIKTMHSALSEEIRITQFPGIPRHHGAMASLASSGQWWVQLTVTKGNLMSAKSEQQMPRHPFMSVIRGSRSVLL